MASPFQQPFYMEYGSGAEGMEKQIIRIILYNNIIKRQQKNKIKIFKKCIDKTILFVYNKDNKNKEKQKSLKKISKLFGEGNPKKIPISE